MDLLTGALGRKLVSILYVLLCAIWSRYLETRVLGVLEIYMHFNFFLPCLQISKLSEYDICSDLSVSDFNDAGSR